MKRLSVFLSALAIAALLAPDARAQRAGRGGFGRGGGGELSLLQQKSVQDELKLSSEQLQKVDAAAAKLRESMADFRDLSQEQRRERFADFRKSGREALAKILDEAQQKRLRQITLQQGGSQALADAEVSQALGLNDEQKQQIGRIQDDVRGQMRDLFQAAAGGDRGEIREKMQALQSAAGDKMKALLSTEQQAKWNELLGEPFSGEITRPQFPGRGGRRGASPPADRSSATTVSQVFRLAGFKADDDDNDDDGDDDAKRPKTKKTRVKKGPDKAEQAARRDSKARQHRGSHGRGHQQHAQGDHHRQGHSHGAAMRHGGGPHADVWARVARSMGHHSRRHGGPPSFGRRGPGGFHGAHHGFGPGGGFGPAFGHHTWHGRRGPQSTAAWRFRPHGEHGFAFAGPPRHHGHGQGHGAAHFANHRGSHQHHGFASWHMRPGDRDRHGHGNHVDRQRDGKHDRPHGPPREPDRRRSEAAGPEQHLTAGDHDAQAIERLAALERSLDLLAQQLEERRQSLRR